MTKCNITPDLFPACKSRKVEIDFEGGNITSDGGGLLIRQADRKLDLTKQVAQTLYDPRRQKSCDHRQLHMLRQRIYGALRAIYGLALGYEDLNDHGTLREDPAFQTFVGRDRTLAHPSTLCRFENRADREAAALVNKLLVDQFIESHKKPPEEVILDFDCTDDPVHGQQEGRFFHGYYDQYCFLPLYVFCGAQLLVAYLRTSRIDPAKHAWAILSLLVKRMRGKWPDVRIIFRGDSGFCRWRMFRWCDTNNVGYSALAYCLVEAIRRLALRGTELAKAQCGTIRLKLFKIGAAVLRNSRRIRFHLSTAYPYKQLFMLATQRLAPG